MQPFPTKKSNLPPVFFFQSGQNFKVKVWKDPRSAEEKGPGLLDNLGTPIYEGQITLKTEVDIDVEGPNKDQFERASVNIPAWQTKLDDIGNVLNGKYKGKGTRMC